MQHKYLISVIMPVYNSALYIGEAIESVIAQTIGKESIQLIIVNDGSSDNSAEIIREYQGKYPECITYIEKENGGVSSARNEALTHVEGKYTAFLDPDDTISPNTYADIIAFFEKNYEKTSVVSYPIFFFGAREGAHPLNDKFNGENRVIDLEKEPVFQIHITASVIKSEIARQITFKSLATSEDAEALLRVLIDTPRLGIVNEARYNYRKREASLIATAPQKGSWYLDHLNGYFKSIIEYALEGHKKIPQFVQNAIMYDLAWKIKVQKKPECLTDEEASAFESELYKIISLLDDNTILDSAILSESVKYYLIAKKHNEEFDFQDDDIFLPRTSLAISSLPYVLEIIEQENDKIKIYARILAPVNVPKITQGALYVGGTRIQALQTTYEAKASLLGKEIVSSVCLEYEIPSDHFTHKVTAYFALCTRDIEIISNNVQFGKHFPLEKGYVSSFAELKNAILTHDESALIFEPKTKKALKKHRYVFERELWKSNGFAERKAVIARKLARFYKAFCKKPIWLISDRLSTADDNGEALFDYLNKIKFKGAKYYFAIREGKDFSRLKRQGRVVNRASLKYKILHLASSVIISSQAEDFVTNPFDYYGAPYKDILTQKPFVFLQHGVIKDDLSAWLNKYNKNIRGFVTSAVPEYDSILNTPPYHYTERELWLTGLPRFDRLDSQGEKIITIMPTWRRYLVDNIDIATGRWKSSDKLQDSEYIRFWNAIINDSRIADALQKYGYKMVLVPHPNMQGMCDFIDTPPHVRLDCETSYNDHYKRSSLIITDYSSAVFDFAYLEKPIIYAQFDREHFFSGAHTYNEGYFDYEKNGFGKVAYTLDDTINAIIKCIESDCQIDTLYLDRIREFFKYHDKRNCERVVEKILTLGE